MPDNIEPPLIAHIIFRLDFGGLENGLVNLINHMPTEKYRHVVICATDFTDFKKRITNTNVTVYALNKKPGNDLSAYYRLWKLLRKLKPDIVHSRNLGTIEYVIPSMLAGVKYRVHGEHGRDMSDIDGANKKYILLRRLYSPFLKRFVALSKDLEQWLLNTVRVNANKVVQLYNGVDLTRFHFSDVSHKLLSISPQVHVNDVLIGTVGRLQSEKDQATLINAFALLIDDAQINTKALKLILIGDGPDRSMLEDLVERKSMSERVIFLGARNDISDLLSCLDIFVLPSRGEGISNTILEAMACSLPVVATRVGGNPELVEENNTGLLVPVNSPEKMAVALRVYLSDKTLAQKHGRAGRQRVESYFSIDKMVVSYVEMYDVLMK